MTSVCRLLAYLGVALAAAGFNSPADADITARYSDDNGRISIVEVADDGRARFGEAVRKEGAGPPDYSLFLPAGDYFIWFRDGDRKVSRWDVHNEAFWEGLAESLADMPMEEAEVPEPRPMGGTSVNGRRGQAFTVSTVDEQLQTFVISGDPALAPLQSAWQRFYRSRPDMHPKAPQFFNVEIPQVLALLGRGAPIQAGDLRLVSISHGQIPAERFRIPERPLAKAEIKALIGRISVIPNPARR